MPDTTRRGLLQTLGIASAVGVAGCSSLGAGSDGQSASSRDNRTSPDNATSADETIDVEPAESVEPTNNWPMVGYEPSSTQYAPGGSAPEGEAEQRWALDVATRITTQPMVADGRVYVVDQDRALRVLDPATGEERWRYDVETELFYSPAVRDGTVYFGAEGNVVTALDAADGSLQWRTETDARRLSAPAVDDSSVYITDVEGILYVLDARTGELRWRHDTQTGSATNPAVAAGTVYLGVGTGMQALNAEDGSIEWRYGDAWTYEPSVHEDLVVGTSGAWHVYAVDSADGSRVWQRSIEPDGKAALAYGAVFMPDYNDRLHALDAQSGETIWSVDVESDLNTAPAVVDGIVFVTTGSAGVVGYDAADGSRVFEAPVDSAVTAPTVANGSVYVGTSQGGGRVHAFDTPE